MAEPDPLLVRQLKRLGLEDLDEPPSREAWPKVLARISDHYRAIADDRALLARSLELSTAEMTQLQVRVATERDRLRGVVTAIGDALTAFHDVANSRGGVEVTRSKQDVTGSITMAKRRFSARLAEIFPLEAEPDDLIDEIRTNFLYLGDQLVQLLHEMSEKASLKEQLEVARVVQQMLVPAKDVIVRPFVRLAGYFHPASECGGDWWTAHDLPDEKVLTVIGDVTGHGIASAIITGAAKAACDLARTFTSGRITPGALLEMMNCCIYEAGKQKLMMPCTASIFDPATRSLTIANAGHHFPYLVRRGALRQLISHGSPLGAASTSEYPAATVQLEAGDAILWFTDGVTECENAEREQFTERRLRALFQSAAEAGPERARAAIVEAIGAFSHGQPQADDITFVVASVE
ncbi:MAG: PP2C family protein-serine/threonine phosphatase [Byssovorax sp.]